jgi:hypothetical protein
VGSICPFNGFNRFNGFNLPRMPFQPLLTLLSVGSTCALKLRVVDVEELCRPVTAALTTAFMEEQTQRNLRSQSMVSSGRKSDRHLPSDVEEGGQSEEGSIENGSTFLDLERPRQSVQRSDLSFQDLEVPRQSVQQSGLSFQRDARASQSKARVVRFSSTGVQEIYKGDSSMGRGLHSSTFWLNVSAFCGTGGAFSGCLGIVQEI